MELHGGPLPTGEGGRGEGAVIIELWGPRGALAGVLAGAYGLRGPLSTSWGESGDLPPAVRRQGDGGRRA